MPEPNRKGISGWLNGKLDGLTPVEPSRAPTGDLDLASLARDVARAGWEEPPGGPASDDEVASARRLAFVVAYAKNPLDPSFADRTAVYGILSKEQTYQLRLARQNSTLLAQLPDTAAFAARRAALVAARDEAQVAAQKIFKLMQRVVGRRVAPPTPTTAKLEPPPPDAPLDAVFAHLDDMLKAGESPS